MNETPQTESATLPTRQATEEDQDSVLGLLHQTAELLAEKGERDLATAYLEAALNIFCCWQPSYVPYRKPDGKLVWETEDGISMSQRLLPPSDESTTASSNPK